MANRRGHSLWAVSVVIGSAALVAAGGCSPLPGPSLDPLYLGSSVRARTAALEGTPSPIAPARDAKGATGATLWIGRYQDSRGSGEVTFSLVHGTTTVSGTWRLRTGGGGPVTGVAEAGGHRLQLRMENTAPECPAILEGSAETTDTTLTGSYRGKDCEGPVADGRLELRRR